MIVCICCAKKFFPEIREYARNPGEGRNKILTPELDFFGEENLESRKALADRHHERIRHSDAIYVYNPSGLIGRNTNLEMGFALALGKRIFAFERLDDLGIDCFIDRFLTLDELTGLVREGQILDEDIKLHAGREGLRP